MIMVQIMIVGKFLKKILRKKKRNYGIIYKKKKKKKRKYFLFHTIHKNNGRAGNVSINSFN